ncbi:MAG: hypothetical protein PHN56_04435 [Candidatus Nanoarchaeia archaeon]|nr:hypothetical protein [Candidatus Nanoarchaeia archaeon]
MKYPKLAIFTAALILGLIIFGNSKSIIFTKIIPNLGVFGYFLSGFFYVYSFTSGSAAAILFNLSLPENFYELWAFSSLGAAMADLILLLFVQSFFENEIIMLSKSKSIKKLDAFFKKFFKSFKRLFYLIISSILIASPLPTEIGVFIVSSTRALSLKFLLLIITLLHALGILFIISSKFLL